MVNRNPIKEFVSLEGLPNGQYQLIRSTKEGMNQIIGTYQIEDGTLYLEIAPSSIYFLTTR
jgi:hypothetical protein